MDKDSFWLKCLSDLNISYSFNIRKAEMIVRLKCQFLQDFVRTWRSTISFCGLYILVYPSKLQCLQSTAEFLFLLNRIAAQLPESFPLTGLTKVKGKTLVLSGIK